MREIKFRAWDKQDKIMYDWEEISIEKEQVFIRDGDLYKTFEQVELMQYTGLKDKNGKKIFEGDIVETEYKAKGIVEWQKEKAGFDFNTKYPMWPHPIYLMGGDREIIGNIYENPELLKADE